MKTLEWLRTYIDVRVDGCLTSQWTGNLSRASSCLCSQRQPERLPTTLQPLCARIWWQKRDGGNVHHLSNRHQIDFNWQIKKAHLKATSPHTLAGGLSRHDYWNWWPVSTWLFFKDLFHLHKLAGRVAELGNTKAVMVQENAREVKIDNRVTISTSTTNPSAMLLLPADWTFPLSNAQPHPQSADNLTLSSFAVYISWRHGSTQLYRFLGNTCHSLQILSGQRR